MEISAFFKEKILTKNFLYDVLLALGAFLIPLIAIMIIYAVNGFTLNSHSGYTIIGFDMQSQYIAILRHYKYVLTHNESLVYTTMRNMGGEYLSIFAYYVSSPFNLLTVFIKDVDLPLFFLWSNIIKMAFASFNMYLLMRITTKEKNIGYLAFAFGYGLISYFWVEMHNYMWFDSIMILPLVMLGFKLLEKGKHHWVYAITLAYALGTSWYIGALICMFLVIFYIYRVICLDTKQERINFTVRFGVTSVAGGLISAALWFTAIVHLAGTKAGRGLPDFGWFPISLYFGGFLSDNFYHIEVIMNNSGWATMFTSIVTLVFAQLFVLNKEYSAKERFGALGIFVIYFIAMQNTVLNALFHGGQEPSWFPARFSFVLGFMVCYFGALEFRKLDKTQPLHLIAPVASAIVIIPIVTLVGNAKLIDDQVAYYKLNVLSLVLYIATIALVLGYILVKTKLKWDSKWIYMGLSSLIVVLTGVSSSTSADKSLKLFTKSNHAQKYEVYLQDCTFQLAVDKLKIYDPADTYRAEITNNRPGNYNRINNNPFFYGYNGLSDYTSNAKKSVQHYFLKLGYHDNDYFDKFEGGSTLAVSSLLNVKYLIDQNGYIDDKPYYQYHYPFEKVDSILIPKQLDPNNPNPKEEEITDGRKMDIYKNDFALPFGFAVNDNGYSYINEGERIGEKVRWFDHFEYQNEIFKTFVKDVVDSDDKQKDIFVPFAVDTITVGDGLTFTEDEFGNRYYTGKGQIRYTVAEPEQNENNNLYFYNKNNIWHIDNVVDSRYVENNTYWNTGIRPVRPSTNGRHTLIMRPQYDLNNDLVMPEFYMERMDVLREFIDKIKQQAAYDLKTVKTKTSYALEGSFDLLKENQMFIFTLPFEKDFKVYIDGKRVNTTTKWNIFTGIELKNYALGKHTIKLVYKDSAFVFGFIFTNVGIGGLVGIYLMEKKLANKKKKSSEEI